MERLFQKRLLSNEEHGFYNLYNARILTTNPRIINPYLVGLKIFVDIEERWNKGRFGLEWKESKDPKKYESWDLKLGLGRQAYQS